MTTQTPLTDERERQQKGILCGSANLDLARKIEKENSELRSLLTWLLSFPKCTCQDHDYRDQQIECCCGYDKKMKKALSAIQKK